MMKPNQSMKPTALSRARLSATKKAVALVALAMVAFTVRATELIPYLAIPVGIGYAIDAKGVRQPNAVCLHDAVFRPPLRYPYELRSRDYGDSSAWARYKGNGLYRVEIDMNTGHVNQVVTIKSIGQAFLDKANSNALKRWIFNPGKWKEITIPVVVRTKAVGVLNKSW